jgi:phosphoenolpyruvate carboxykinase (GTP)
MFRKKEGIDIVSELGGIATYKAALKVFESKMDAEHFARIQRIKNTEVILKIANAIVLCGPDKVFVNTGSEADRQYIRELSIQKGEEAPLPMTDHTIHYDLKEEQGRIIDRTFYIANPNDLVSSLANKIYREKK